ncbi:hypothetical protein GCM10010124_35510 [Pilimelia terevasa]|uniref:histidine kinase n=1 Tax=Pilimelia terevasa TaxID=53372 RepID=A0A8J3BUL6_9ACTN|nr:sensor histidine kinase [Pilimelia terevasa]GGK39791.1 hypothetical protein GCM10010124_35510 [Pilimelia terevasa]
MTEILRGVLRVERDIFVLRQCGREVAALVGLDGQDQVRVATALSEMGREVLGVGGADVVFAVAEDPARLVVDLYSRGRLDGAGRTPARQAAARLVDDLAVTDEGGATRVRLTRRLAGGALPADVLSRLSAEAAALVPATPLEELAAQNQSLIAALEEVSRQRNDLTRLNAELQETNQGVLALYAQLSEELEETNRGVVALYAEIDDKSAQLHAASEAKSRFLANISHELRAPLTAVIGLSRMLADPSSDPVTADQATQVALIHDSARGLLVLVNDLLDLAKAEAGHIEPTWDDVDLPLVLRQLSGTLHAIGPRPGVALVIEDAPADVTLRSDEALLAQVLRNLLTNGMKFTEHGEVRLRCRAEGAQCVEFTVTDTGIGIAPEQLDRIFEDFYQVRGQLQASVTGTGLGLPYARRLTGILGGTLRVASEPGVGSTFTVALPRRPAAAAAVP